MTTAIELEQCLCPRCHSAESRPVYSAQDYLYHIPGTFTVSECTACHLQFQNPRPAKKDLGKLYPPNYSAHIVPGVNTPQYKRNMITAVLSVLTRIKDSLYYRLIKRTSLEKLLRRLDPFSTLRRNIELTPRLIPGGSLLEIGCARGQRLEQLKNDGWQDLHGIELMPEAVRQAREKGFSVECGAIEDLLPKYPDSSFDVIVTSFVLEHLLDPFAVVKLIYDKLKPQGQFLFSTVNRSSLDARIYKKYWAGYDLPRHMVYFSKKDLKNMLSGFSKSAFYFQNAPIDFIRSSSWRKASHEDTVWDTLVLMLGEKILSPIFWVIARSGFTTRVSVIAEK
jgi:2-polyprenyl-3-methyl-5-hydroxy-6-metoxy-1,4-benzoquinol methylase